MKNIVDMKKSRSKKHLLESPEHNGEPVESDVHDLVNWINTFDHNGVYFNIRDVDDLLDCNIICFIVGKLLCNQ